MGAELFHADGRTNRHIDKHVSLFVSCGAEAQRGPWPPHFLRFLDHTQRRIIFGRTPLDEWSARRRDLYLTTHDTHDRQTSMPPVGFEPTVSASERPQTYALDRAATETGIDKHDEAFFLILRMCPKRNRQWFFPYSRYFYVKTCLLKNTSLHLLAPWR